MQRASSLRRSSGRTGGHRFLPALRPHPVATLLALCVALFSLLPLGFIVLVTFDVGWETVRELVFRPRVGELLINTVYLEVVTIPISIVVAVGLAWLTERTDLYALGLLLYELSYGHRLYDGVDTRVEPGGSLPTDADVDPALQSVILWALALDPAARPPSATAIAARLPAISPHPPVQQPPANPGFPRWAAVMFAAVIGLGAACPAAAQTQTETEFQRGYYLQTHERDLDTAARLFENHPHFSVFPGDGVDIMPFLTDPAP